jgi:hypothetical protein
VQEPVHLLVARTQTAHLRRDLHLDRLSLLRSLLRYEKNSFWDRSRWIQTSHSAVSGLWEARLQVLLLVRRPRRTRPHARLRSAVPTREAVPLEYPSELGLADPQRCGDLGDGLPCLDVRALKHDGQVGVPELLCSLVQPRRGGLAGPLTGYGQSVPDAQTTLLAGLLGAPCGIGDGSQ